MQVGCLFWARVVCMWVGISTSAVFIGSYVCSMPEGFGQYVFITQRHCFNLLVHPPLPAHVHTCQQRPQSVVRMQSVASATLLPVPAEESLVARQLNNGGTARVFVQAKNGVNLNQKGNAHPRSIFVFVWVTPPLSRREERLDVDLTHEFRPTVPYNK